MPLYSELTKNVESQKSLLYPHNNGSLRNKFIRLISNIYEHIFRALSNIYDGAFLQKLLIDTSKNIPSSPMYTVIESNKE